MNNDKRTDTGINEEIAAAVFGPVVEREPDPPFDAEKESGELFSEAVRIFESYKWRFYDILERIDRLAARSGSFDSFVKFCQIRQGFRPDWSALLLEMNLARRHQIYEKEAHDYEAGKDRTEAVNESEEEE